MPYFFIAKRFQSAKGHQIRYARPIINIAVAGVCIGILVMLMSLAISTGFKGEISDNVSAANAHFKVLPFGYRDNPELISNFPDSLTNGLSKILGVAHTQNILYQPVLLERGGSIYGLLLKGNKKDIPPSFKTRFMQSGTMPENEPDSKQICLSETIAAKLAVDSGAIINVYVTNTGENIKKRKFIVSGIFKTGVPGIDEEIAFASFPEIARLHPGIPKIFISPKGKGFEVKSNANSSIFLYKNGDLISRNATTLESAALGTYALVQSKDGFTDSLVVNFNESETPEITFDAQPELQAAQAIEIYTNDFSSIDQLETTIFDALPYELELVSVKQDLPEVFNWLNLLDTNVVVLLVIMAIVSLVNMASALLVLIVEKTQAIALLKTMGGPNVLIRKVFLSIAGLIMGKGLLFGNILFAILYFAQNQFQFFTLNQAQYYVDHVPMNISLFTWVLTNIATLVFCLIVLILPTILISRIYPAKALRIE